MTSRLEALETDRFLSHAETLAQLSALPAWGAWTSLLHDMRQAALEELARVSEPGEFRYWQGVASALGEVLDRPRRICAAAASLVEEEEANKVGIRPELRSIVGMGLDAGGDV